METMERIAPCSLPSSVIAAELKALSHKQY